VSKTSSIRPVVQIQYRFVTDRQTDRRTHDDSKYRVSIASRGKNYEYVGHFQQVSKVTSPHSFKFDFRRNLHKITPSSGGILTAVSDQVLWSHTSLPAASRSVQPFCTAHRCAQHTDTCTQTALRATSVAQDCIYALRTDDVTELWAVFERNIYARR